MPLNNDNPFFGKHVVLGVTGSIAAYKAAVLSSSLVKEGAEVRVIETKNALKLVGEATFEGLTHNRVLIDTFSPDNASGVEHVDLAGWTDVFVVAPASADIIAKFACGIADDMLSTAFLAVRRDTPVLVAPAMNTNMYENPATQENLATLRRRGIKIIEPSSGYLACGTEGKGRMAEPSEILFHIEAAVSEQDLFGKKIVVSAGPTAEDIDPVRFITNRSSGKMGFAIAESAARRGALVTLVSGPTVLSASPLIEKVISVRSADEMHEAIIGEAKDAYAVIMAAAVADYTPEVKASEKLHKGDHDMSIPLIRTKDILLDLSKNKGDTILVGFSMETEDLIENAKRKLQKKALDMICANSVKQEGAGFSVDTNVLTLITKDEMTELPIMSKKACAD
ncbi:MAG: bifunctional phosphopantothenoylcysteine decarboxylase/phosphopantothenate--cysteine ligase CoaBC, partial [Lachnospiraceae bacterium]|nr:bifunctional phosphopantothenoylcysteine decarboxylase/phosphopantothenate--cysteine ligase CoaBC [Lachnospiraceae bacterium]